MAIPMKKKVLWICGVIVALLVVAYLSVAFFLGSIVRAAVNRFGPALTQTKLELASASLSPFSGNGTLTGLFVGNPNGWSSDKAFYLTKVHIEVAPSSIFKDTIIVNEITIDGPEFVYETKIVASNIGDLLKNIQNGAGGATAAQEPVAKSGHPMKFVVKRFRLTNGHVTLGVGAAAMTLPMPPVSLDNVGASEGGITSGQLALAVMRSVTSNIVSATTQAAGKIGSTLGAAAGNSAKSAGDAVKGLFGGKN